MNISKVGTNEPKKSSNPLKRFAMAVSASMALLSGGTPNYASAVATVNTKERVASIIDSAPAIPSELTVSREPTPQVETTPEPKATTDINESEKGLQSAVVGDDIRSVTGFMRANGWVEEQWGLLVDAGNIGLRGGDRIRNPNRDLIMGHRYFLARSEKEATILSKILREKTIKKRAENKVEKKTKPATHKKATKKTKSYTVTRPYMSAEENAFLTDISQKKAYVDQGTMYEFRTPDTELKALASKAEVDAADIPTIKLLMSHIAKRESGFNYGAFGPTIRHRSMHRGHRAIGLTQIMPVNWIRWSQENFGTILETTDVNQEKLGFVQIAKYYNEYARKGQPLEKIANHLAIRWYGSVTVNGLPSPSEYAQGFVKSVLSDKTHIIEARKALSNPEEATTVTTDNVSPVAMETETTKTVSEITTNHQAQVDQIVDSNISAANDSYFKTPTIETGLAKVVSLQNYLLKSSSERDQEVGQRLVRIHTDIDTQKNVLAGTNPKDTSGIINTQIQLGEQMKQALATAAKMAPNHPITQPILLALKETNSTVIQLQKARERLMTRKEQELNQQKIAANAELFSSAREGYATKILGGRAA